jgi:hypothetical protein
VSISAGILPKLLIKPSDLSLGFTF